MTSRFSYDFPDRVLQTQIQNVVLRGLISTRENARAFQWGVA